MKEKENPRRAEGGRGGSEGERTGGSKQRFERKQTTKEEWDEGKRKRKRKESEKAMRESGRGKPQQGQKRRSDETKKKNRKALKRMEGKSGNRKSE